MSEGSWRETRPRLQPRIARSVSSALTRSIVCLNTGPSAANTFEVVTGTTFPNPKTCLGSRSTRIAGEASAGSVVST